MSDTRGKIEEFFERYTAALLARDAPAVAQLYAVPGLILFPGASIPVTDTRQTEEFFERTWSQYEGIDRLGKSIVVMGEGPASVWADVTWSYREQPQERFCYQLVPGPDGYRIAVLTPLTRSGDEPCRPNS